MSYDPNIPQPGDQLSVSQEQFLENFRQADQLYGLDHFEYSFDGEEAGHHRKLTLPEQAVNPAILAPLCGSCFTKDDGSGNTVLYTGQVTGGVASNLQVTAVNGTGSKLNLPILPVAAVMFDRSGTILAQKNVSSVVFGLNTYATINFTTALSSANYYCTGSTQITGYVPSPPFFFAQTTTSISLFGGTTFRGSIFADTIYAAFYL